MSTAPALILTRIALAAVFAVAGVAKLVDRAATRKAVAAFGAPQRIACPFAIVLPLAELATAALLLPGRTAVYGALAAIALLAIFSGAIAVSLARGRAPDCHCFGQLHSAPTSWKTLARNALLLGIGTLALASTVVGEPTSAVAWIAELSGAELASFAVVACAAVVLALGGAAFLSLLRSYGQVLTRLDRIEAALSQAGLDLEDAVAMPEIGLEPGSTAPTFRVRSLSGETVSLETLIASGLPSLLLFTSPHCGPCKALLPVAAAWQRQHGEELAVVFASDGPREEVLAQAEEHDLEHVVLDESRYLYDAFKANGTPSAVLIRQTGRSGVGSPPDATGSSTSSRPSSRGTTESKGFRSGRRCRPSSFRR